MIDGQIVAEIGLNLGLPFSSQDVSEESFPFKKLLIKRRKEVLTDRIQDLDWSDAGPELPPEQWHAELQAALAKKDDPHALLILGTIFSFFSCSLFSFSPFSSILSLYSCALDIGIDCRNTYESSLGTFQGAQPLLQTDSFS